MSTLHINREGLAWAAGLFDGEGTIGTRRNGSTARLRRIAMSLGMTTEPAVDRFLQSVGGLGTVYRNLKQSKYPRAKPVYRWAAQNYEHVQAVVAFLWRWLSEHKRQQAKRALLSWKTERHGSMQDLCWRGHVLSATRRRSPSGSLWCAACQPIRVSEYRRKVKEGGVSP